MLNTTTALAIQTMVITTNNSMSVKPTDEASLD
jgi:hypothetical protein